MLIGKIPFYSYSYGIAVACVTVMIYFIFKLKKEKIPLWHLILTIFLIVLFALLGARIMWSFEVKHVTVEKIFDLRFRNFRLLGGLIFSILGFTITFFIYKRKYQLSIEKYVSASLEAIFLAFAIGKFNCFLNGCCYGIGTKLPWGIRRYEEDIPRHPVQIYETIAMLFIFALLRILRDKISWSQKISLSIFLYIIFRMILELFRVEASIFMNGPTWVIYFILLIICIIIFMANIKKKIKKEEKDIA